MLFERIILLNVGSDWIVVGGVNGEGECGEVIVGVSFGVIFFIIVVMCCILGKYKFFFVICCLVW